MFVEYRHRFRKENGVLVGYPDELYKERSMNDPEKIASEGKYLGRISEHEIIGQAGSGMVGTSLVYIRRNFYKMEEPSKLSLGPIPKYKNIRTIGGWHGSDLNTNLVVGFSKKQLIEIINSMQDSDILNIAHDPTGYKG